MCGAVRIELVDTQGTRPNEKGSSVAAAAQFADTFV